MGSALFEIMYTVVNTLTSMYMFIIILRFLLQAVRADFYNPISQFIVKATNPLVTPIRKVIPGFAGFDWASIVLLIGVQLALIIFNVFMMNNDITALKMFILSLVGSTGLFLNLYFWSLIIMIAASWLAPQSYNPALLLIRQILEPIMAPIRKMLPDMGGIDFSPMIILLIIFALKTLLLGVVSELHISNPADLVSI